MHPDDKPPPEVPAEPPTQPYRPPGITRWQSLAGLAGLVLASTCFLPAVQACNPPVVPFTHFCEGISSLSNHPSKLDTFSNVILIFCMFILAYSFGALEALGALLRMIDLHTWSQRISKTTGAYFYLIALICLADALGGALGYGIKSDWGLLLAVAGVPVLALTHMWRSRNQGASRWICLSFMGSLFCFLWFTFWFIGYLTSGNARYGLYLSWTASTLLLWAVVGEARAVARTSWPKTVWLLIISRLPDGRPKGYCPQCEYNLFGLPEPRCPECGRPFTPEEAMPAAPHSR